MAEGAGRARAPQAEAGAAQRAVNRSTGPACAERWGGSGRAGGGPRRLEGRAGTAGATLARARQAAPRSLTSDAPPAQPSGSARGSAAAAAALPAPARRAAPADDVTVPGRRCRDRGGWARPACGLPPGCNPCVYARRCETSWRSHGSRSRPPRLRPVHAPLPAVGVPAAGPRLAPGSP